MRTLIDAGLILLGYLLGSIPFGLIWVKLISGKDIRHVASGRTGGTNAARAAGPGAGILTAIMDGAKGACAAWIAMGVSPDHHWVHVLAPLAAILGHNYSVFLIERDSANRLRLRGGAGGGPTVGGAIGLWWPSVLIVMPIALLVFFGIGYASVTTISIAVTITAIFAVGYFLHLPWARLPDLIYGLAALFLLFWALRPNIRALVEGRERFHGWRPWHGSRPLFPAHTEPGRTPRQASGTGAKSKPRKRARTNKPEPSPLMTCKTKSVAIDWSPRSFILWMPECCRPQTMSLRAPDEPTPACCAYGATRPARPGTRGSCRCPPGPPHPLGRRRPSSARPPWRIS